MLLVNAWISWLKIEISTNCWIRSKIVVCSTALASWVQCEFLAEYTSLAISSKLQRWQYLVSESFPKNTVDSYFLIPCALYGECIDDVDGFWIYPPLHLRSKCNQETSLSLVSVDLASSVSLRVLLGKKLLKFHTPRLFWCVPGHQKRHNSWAWTSAHLFLYFWQNL